MRLFMMLIPSSDKTVLDFARARANEVVAGRDSSHARFRA